MTDPTFRLVYYSRNRLPHLDATTVDEILQVSRHNNARVGVTGALMFNSGCFAQVLEGPRDAVEATFERIQQDERHGDVSLLAFGPVDGRAFESWSMGYVGSSAGGAEYARSSSEGGFDPSSMTGDRLFSVLHDLALQEERRAA